MGVGSYSSVSRGIRAETLYYATASTGEIFKSRSINSSMDPHGVLIRESRDSIEHPESAAIMIALDETGSMGSVPHFLVKEGLPHIMDTIIKAGILHPQVLFAGVGDHTCDRAPFQIGQYESSDALLDKWLTDIYLEGNGGAGDGESYMLPWYFAAYRTEIDCLSKRGIKGLLFTIGDEPTHPTLEATALHRIFGEGQYEDFSSADLLNKASAKYACYHIHIKETRSGSRPMVMNFWSQLMPEGLIIAEHRESVARIIAAKIVDHFKRNITIVGSAVSAADKSPDNMML